MTKISNTMIKISKIEKKIFSNILLAEFYSLLYIIFYLQRCAEGNDFQKLSYDR